MHLENYLFIPMTIFVFVTPPPFPLLRAPFISGRLALYGYKLQNLFSVYHAFDFAYVFPSRQELVILCRCINLLLLLCLLN